MRPLIACSSPTRRPLLNSRQSTRAGPTDISNYWVGGFAAPNERLENKRRKKYSGAPRKGNKYQLFWAQKNNWKFSKPENESQNTTFCEHFRLAFSGTEKFGGPGVHIRLTGGSRLGKPGRGSLPFASSGHPGPSTPLGLPVFRGWTACNGGLQGAFSGSLLGLRKGHFRGMARNFSGPTGPFSGIPAYQLLTSESSVELSSSTVSRCGTKTGLSTEAIHVTSM
ncbi:hypothetical protein BD414DRAFT_511084 [Trametes punicea]|nr:hypothetical protein BD414DRAFT_511084 [Trametes punicea]